MVNKRLKLLILIVFSIIILIGLSTIVYAACPHGVSVCGINYNCGVSDGVCPESYGANCCDAGCYYPDLDCAEHGYRDEYFSGSELWFNDDTSDRACCSSSGDCVFNGNCFGNGVYDLNGDGRKEARCYTSNGRWINTDYHSSYCSLGSYNWNVGGGDATGDSYAGTWGGTSSGYCHGRQIAEGGNFVASIHCCCGDDAGENYRTGRDLTSACCDTANECVIANQCMDYAHSEGTTEVSCIDGIDNDCDGEWDYDTLDRGGGSSPYGDSDCPVGVTNIVVSNTAPYANTNINITCTVDVGVPVNSIFAYIDENNNGIYDGTDRDCEWPSGSSWLDNSHVRFVNCNVGSDGTKNAACGVYSSSSEPYNRSYQSGSDVTQSITLGSCGDGTVNGLEECEGSDCEPPGSTSRRCNASTCTWYSIPSENNCTDSIDNDCDSAFDGMDSDCPEGSGILSAPSLYRGCEEGTDNDGDGLYDKDDPGCCDFCLADLDNGFDNFLGEPCGTGCDCGGLIFNWEEPALMDEYCCGDDPGENFISTTIGLTTYYACCDNGSDCVDSNGSCQLGVEELFELCTNGMDDDCDGSVDREDDTCQGIVTGYVFDEDSVPVAGALVKGSPPGFGTEYESSATTEISGEYNITDPLVGKYSFIARKEGYDDKVMIINVIVGTTVQVNFTVKNGSCHADCTDYYGNCNPACEGAEFGGGETCTFVSELCYNRPKGFIVRDIVDGTVYEYTCCEEDEGPVRTYSVMDATVTGDVESLYDYVVNVKLRGRYVRMHILIWKPEE